MISVEPALKLLRSTNEVVTASQGNFSFKKSPDSFYVTPSGIPWAGLTEDQLVLMKDRSFDWQAYGNRVPSSEWRLHAMIYGAGLGVTSIFHSHPPYCTVLSDTDIDLYIGEHPSLQLVPRTETKFMHGTYPSTDLLPEFKPFAHDFHFLLRGHGLVSMSKTNNVERLVHKSYEIERLAKVTYLKAILEKS